MQVQSNPFTDLSSFPASSAPPVPAKSSTSRPAHNRANTMEAIKDTVVIRNSESISRSRGRSQTQPVSPTSNGRSEGHAATHRSVSQDSASKNAPQPPAEKGKPAKSRGKKGSSHADVIDRLDFSGVGPMFHHDGPFDACAPSRNRLRTKAPMAAWSAEDGTPLPAPEPKAPRVQTYMTEPKPKTKVDAIAEAWGTHEPEPFEDFSAGGGHANDYRHNYSPSTTDAKRNEPPARRTNRKNALPPPQPIFVPGMDEDASLGPPLTDSPGMKHSMSIMHRIRKMRETPNVPVNNDDPSIDDYDSPEDSNSNRPTHKPQNSFLGRFGRNANGNVGATSVEHVYVDDRKEKALPKPPSGSSDGSSENGVVGYPDSTSIGASPSTNGGLGRRTSLLEKVGRVVRGTK